MRAFSTLLIAAALALSVNAGLVKRTDDPQIQICMDDLVSANAQLTIVKDAVDTFTRSQGYAGAIAIHEKEQVLEDRLTTAGASCCAISTVASSSDADEVLGVIDTMVPLVQGALTSIVTKKPEFQAILLATTIVKNDIKSLNDQANELLDNCLFDVTPASHLDIATAYVNDIKSSFDTAKAAYDIA